MPSECGPYPHPPPPFPWGKCMEFRVRKTDDRGWRQHRVHHEDSPICTYDVDKQKYLCISSPSYIKVRKSRANTTVQKAGQRGPWHGSSHTQNLKNETGPKDFAAWTLSVHIHTCFRNFSAWIVLHNSPVSYRREPRPGTMVLTLPLTLRIDPVHSLSPPLLFLLSTQMIFITILYQ